MQHPARDNPEQTDLLLVNPTAGGGRGTAVLSDLRKFASLRGWSVEICVTQNPDDLVARARRAAKLGRKRIFVLGGDGTFHLLLNAVAAYADLVLGVIPAGGGNDLSAALGLPADPIEATALLLEGQPRELDIVRVRTSDGNERFYSGGGGVGLDSAAVRHANGAYRILPGRSRYVLSAVRALFGFRAIQVRITVGANESQPLEASALLVGALNTPSYGGGLYLAPNAKIDDGSLEVVLLENLSVGQILTLLPALAFRGELKTQRLRRISTPHVRIESDPPCWFHGDGELLGLTPVDVSIVPQAVRVLGPAQNTEG